MEANPEPDSQKTFRLYGVGNGRRKLFSKIAIGISGLRGDARNAARAESGFSTYNRAVIPLPAVKRVLRKFWLLFAQACTLCVAVLFVVATLRPDLLPRLAGKGSNSSVVLVRETVGAPPGTANVIAASYAEAAKKAMPSVVNIYTSKDVGPRNPLGEDDMLRRYFPDLKIYARARNRFHSYRLLDLGCELIERETFRSSLHMAREVLIALDTPSWIADTTVARFQAHDEKTLARQQAIYHDETQLIQTSKDAAAELEDLLQQDREDAAEITAKSAPFSPSDVR